MRGEGAPLRGLAEGEAGRDIFFLTKITPVLSLFGLDLVGLYCTGLDWSCPWEEP